MTSNTINLKYLNGLLASNVSNFIFSLIGSNLGSNGYDLNKIFIEQLPIKFTNENHEKRINKLVEEQLTTNKKQTTDSTNFKKWLKTTF